MFFKRPKRRRHQENLTVSLARHVEQAEARILLTAAIDGTGNNVDNPEWGSTDELLLRLADSDYADGISEIGGQDRPSARVISNVIASTEGASEVSSRMLSSLVTLWGQFIDHDITLTESGNTELTSIEVPVGDPSFDPNGTGTVTIDTFRSAFDASTGTGTSNAREQINEITAFIDGSQVYGSSEEVAASLRTFSGGTLKTSDGDLLPIEDGMFLAGDVRANENVALTSLHTLFVREHNLQAEKIAAEDPSLTDEEIYQQARAIVIGKIQSITYNEWLPALLGTDAIADYDGYDSTINPGISNEFATAAFRFGHSLLADDIEFLDDDGVAVRDSVLLAGAFFNPSLVSENGIDPLLKFLTSDLSSELDTEVVDSVRNFLFGEPGSGGLDLVALNIQRGRDHGLADYNSVREAIGLEPVTTFADITSNPDLQAKLESLYGSVDNIDLWVGGLAEDHLDGSSMGETFSAILVDQFQRLRDGDSNWYQNQFSSDAISEIESSTLSSIIERNTTLTSIQDNAFFFRAEISGTIRKDQNRDGKATAKEPAAAGVTVQLIDTSDGSVIATTTADKKGQYSFDTVDGLETGVYKIQVTAADGTIVASSNDVSITGGDDFESVNVAIPIPKPVKPSPPVKTHVQNKSKGKPASAVSPQTVVSPTVVHGNVAANLKQGSSIKSTAASSGAASSTSNLPKSTASAKNPGGNVVGSVGSVGSVANVGKSNGPRTAVPQFNAATLALIDELFAALPKGLL